MKSTSATGTVFNTSGGGKIWDLIASDIEFAAFSSPSGPSFSICASTRLFSSEIKSLPVCFEKRF